MTIDWQRVQIGALVGAWTGHVAALGDMSLGRALALVFVASLAVALWPANRRFDV